MTTTLRHLLAMAAATVAVVAGGPARADAAGAIAGHVAARSGPVCVMVLDPSGQVVTFTATTAAGDYVLEGVPAGAWTVQFMPDLGCIGQVTDEAFQFASGRSTRASADPVAVADGATTAGVNATLAAAAAVRGTVTDAGGSGLGGVCVALQDTAGRDVIRDLTDSEGRYRLEQLPGGAFVVHAVADGCSGAPPTYAPAYHPGVASLGEAAVLTLRPGTVRREVDVRLAAASPTDGGGGGAASAGGAAGAPRVPAAGGIGASGDGRPTEREATARGRARIALLASRTGSLRLDRRRRVALRLLCQRGGAPCAGRIRLSWLRRRGRGRPAGSARFFLPADGRPKVLRVRVRGAGTRLRVALVLRGRTRPSFTATLLLRRAR